MMQDISEALSLLLNMEDQVIVRDLSRAVVEPEAVRQAFKQLILKPPAERTPGESARIWHLQMLLAHIHSNNEFVPEDVALQAAALAASYVADEAVTTVLYSGRLGEITRQIDEIKHREGLTEDEYWPVGEGPEDYHRLVEESDAEIDRIRDTVFVHLLERYGFDRFVRLYEEDPMRFHVMWEAGRRALLLAKGNDKDWDDDDLEADYGHEAVILLRERLEHIARIWRRTE